MARLTDRKAIPRNVAMLYVNHRMRPPWTMPR